MVLNVSQKEGRGGHTIDSRKEAYVCKNFCYAYTTFAKQRAALDEAPP